MNPFPIIPSLQVQVKLPNVFWQLASTEHGFDKHSFVSKRGLILETIL